jgi:uncharacterized protein (UPF0297 family)
MWNDSLSMNKLLGYLLSNDYGYSQMLGPANNYNTQKIRKRGAEDYNMTCGYLTARPPAYPAAAPIVRARL